MMTIGKAVKRHQDAWEKMTGEDAKVTRHKGRIHITTKEHQLEIWLQPYHEAGMPRRGVRFCFRRSRVGGAIDPKVTHQIPQPLYIDMSEQDYLKVLRSLHNCRTTWAKKQ